VKGAGGAGRRREGAQARRFTSLTGSEAGDWRGETSRTDLQAGLLPDGGTRV